MRQAVRKAFAAERSDKRMLKLDIAAGTALGHATYDNSPRGGAHDPVIVDLAALGLSRISYGAQTILVDELLKIKSCWRVMIYAGNMPSGPRGKLLSFCHSQRGNYGRLHDVSTGRSAPGRDSEVQAIPTSAAASDASIAFDPPKMREAELGPRLCQQIHDVIDGRSFFDKYAVAAISMRVLLTIGAIQDYFREEQPNDKAALLDNLHSVLNELEDSEFYDEKIRSFFEECTRYVETTPAPDAIQRLGWEREELSGLVQRIPTMLCKETLGYYKWLARTFDEPGDIVELGSWMGSSTACLAEGLAQNPDRQHKTIHVFDSFVWRDWMRTYTEDPELLAANIREGELFLKHFWSYAEPFRELIDVHQSVLKVRRGELCSSGSRVGGRADWYSGYGFSARPRFE